MWLIRPSIFCSLLTSSINCLYTSLTLAFLLLKYTKYVPTSSFRTCLSLELTFCRCISFLAPSILLGLKHFFRGLPCPGCLKSPSTPSHLSSPSLSAALPHVHLKNYCVSEWLFRCAWVLGWALSTWPLPHGISRAEKSGGNEVWLYNLSFSWNTSGSERDTTNNYPGTRGLTGT